MTRQFHFISGLPRSGSTLLAAILRQNPRFHAGMTSPVGALYTSTLETFSAGSEYASVVDEEKRATVLRGLFHSFYADQANKDVVFDTNRMWTAKLPALAELFPDSRIIACVRNVAWIMDSLERRLRDQPFENTRLFNDPSERATVYSRVNTLAQLDRMVGFAWGSLKEAFYSELAGRMLLVDYELLARAPDKTVRLIYEFLDQPWFEHDFERVAFDAPQFDAQLGLSGLHRVQPKISFQPRRTILPPDLFQEYTERSFWTDQTGSRANVITASPAAE